MSTGKGKRFALVCLALGLWGCTLEEVRDGEYCPDNTTGSYAKDSFSDSESGGHSSASIISTKYCNDIYSYCVATICSMCPKDSIRVQLDDAKNEMTCLPCSELSSCTSKSCDRARERGCQGTCRDGKMYNYYDKIIAVCQNGCDESGEACKTKTDDSCGMGEIKVDGQCICDEANQWTGKTGDCKCASGFHLKNGFCVLDTVTTCGEHEIKGADGKCTCDEDNHWTSDAGKCVCAQGYIEMDDACVEKTVTTCGDHQINDAEGKCVCDAGNHWTDEAGKCVCAQGYIEKSGLCEAIMDCGKGAVWDETAKACRCDDKSGWTGNQPDACQCKEGYLSIGEECQARKTCEQGAVLDEKTNACHCDDANGWVEENGGKCVCAPGYLKIDNKCQERAVCSVGAKLIETMNQCVCDEDNHWAGSDPGKCECAFGYKKDNGSCRLYREGETIVIGKYPQKNGSAISWKILEVYSGSHLYYLLISEYGLDFKAFNPADNESASRNDKSSFAQSQLYSWLNNEFKNEAFGPSDRLHLWADKDGTEVSLMSECDNALCAFGSTKKFMDSDEKRYAQPTAYAAEMSNGECPLNENCYWWLSSTTEVSETYMAQIVRKNGSIPSNGIYKWEKCLVRPVIWVQIDE